MNKIIASFCNTLTFFVGIINTLNNYTLNNQSATIGWFVVVCLSASHIIRDYCAMEKE